MANVKISELNELTQVDDDDLLVVVDTSANETKKIRAENVGTGGGGDSTPIGTIEAFSGSTAPNGYLMCDGSAVSRNAYADLFAVIGTTYGSGDGSTTFNLPNLKGRTIVMLDSTQTEFDTLGETGGSKAMQQHNHNVLVDGYSISLNNGSNSAISVSYSWEQAGSTLTTSLAGTGQSGNLQPYIVLNYVIKAFKVSSTPATSQVVNAYSESTNNVYSCNYVNNSDSYSTSEVKTNKRWIDGKPIYRKIFDRGTSLETFNHNIPNVSNIWIINDYTVRIHASGNVIPLNGGSNSGSLVTSCFPNTTQINIYNFESIIPTQVFICVEYTKTTD